MTQVEAAPDALAKGARADRGRLVQLIVAAVLMGATGVTARTETVRLVVTGQMIADLIILGLAVKIIVGAVKCSQRQSTPK